MPRTARELNEKQIYHIIIRGINKQNIFLEDIDRKTYLKYLKSVKEKIDFEIYAYCLMDNHIHLLIKDSRDSISKIIQSSLVKYSKYFNKKYDRVGHLFQNRFVNQNVKDDGYLLRVQKYIHQNPEIVGICKTNKYKWSSFKEYICEENLCNTKIILNLFNENFSEAKDLFKNYTLKNKRKIQIDYDLEGIKRVCDQDAIKIMKNLCRIDNLIEISQFNKKEQKECIKKIKECKVISAVQISRIIGINRKTVERALK